MFLKETFDKIAEQFTELRHALDENIDNANDAHVRINETKLALNNAGIAIDELEEKVKSKWETLTKRVETCEKANEMFIKALNEQRDVIIKIVNTLNKSSKTTTTKTKKKGK